jgi:imidazolonepropionase-like amidohydrolase
VPAGAEVIDLGDVTLLPGLIDCHTHLLSSGPDDYGTMLLTKSQAYRALEGASNARRTLLAGFTSVRDAENEGTGYADVALRDAINRGLVEGPRMKVATRAIAAVGQYNPFGVSPDLPDFPRGAQMVSGVEEARRAVREQIGNGADLIKVYADWTHPTLTPEELRVIVEEAHKAGKTVAAHATTIEAIRHAVNAGVDSIEHGDKADRATLELMKQKGVWLVPTFGVLLRRFAEVKDEEVRKRATVYVENKRKMLQTARELGVKVALGYDASGEELHGTNAAELTALTSAGFTNLESIRAATTSGAELLGWQDRVGSLEAGKFADVIAVRGNPLSDVKQLEHVPFVMKGGVVVKGGRKATP